MITNVQKWGNSLGLRIPKPFAKEANIETGDQVDIEVENNVLIIKPVRQSYDLKKMISQINNKNIHNEKSTGKPQGQEIW